MIRFHTTALTTSARVGPSIPRHLIHQCHSYSSSVGPSSVGWAASRPNECCTASFIRVSCEFWLPLLLPPTVVLVDWTLAWPCVPTELIDVAADMLLNDCCMNGTLCSYLLNSTITASNHLQPIGRLAWDQDYQIRISAIVAAYFSHQVRAEWFGYRPTPAVHHARLSASRRSRTLLDLVKFVRLLTMFINSFFTA